MVQSSLDNENVAIQGKKTVERIEGLSSSHLPFSFTRRQTVTRR